MKKKMTLWLHSLLDKQPSWLQPFQTSSPSGAANTCHLSFRSDRGGFRLVQTSHRSPKKARWRIQQVLHANRSDLNRWTLEILEWILGKTPVKKRLHRSILSKMKNNTSSTGFILRDCEMFKNSRPWNKWSYKISPLVGETGGMNVIAFSLACLFIGALWKDALPV